MEKKRFREVTMKISIIIPTFNEEENIAKLIRYLLLNNRERHVEEVIICDGGSSDDTLKRAKDAGAKVVKSPRKGRAAQMNFGAKAANGDILYFLHADSFPPSSYSQDIINANLNRFHSGCYKLCFDYEHWFLKLNCWFTQFDVDSLRFGDQSLFVTKEAFQRAGGFDESLIVMEDQEIIKRIRRYARFRILDKAVTTSARKYLENGIFKLQGLFFMIFLLYKLGFSQDQLQKIYRFLIRQGKV